MRPLPGRTSTEPERRRSGGGGGAQDECIDNDADASPINPPLFAHPAAATSSTKPSRDSIAESCVEKCLRLALASGGTISEGARLLVDLTFQAASSFF